MNGRLRQEAADAKLRRWKDKAETKLRLWTKAVLFGVFTGGGIIISAVCVYVILKEGSAPNAVNWATSTLTSMATGIMGYLTGKNSKHD
jgi:Na+/H+ antiporter NhaA